MKRRTLSSGLGLKSAQTAVASVQEVGSGRDETEGRALNGGQDIDASPVNGVHAPIAAADLAQDKTE